MPGILFKSCSSFSTCRSYCNCSGWYNEPYVCETEEFIFKLKNMILIGPIGVDRARKRRIFLRGFNHALWIAWNLFIFIIIWCIKNRILQSVCFVALIHLFVVFCTCCTTFVCNTWENMPSGTMNITFQLKLEEEKNNCSKFNKLIFSFELIPNWKPRFHRRAYFFLFDNHTLPPSAICNLAFNNIWVSTFAMANIPSRSLPCGHHHSPHWHGSDNETASAKWIT